MEHAYQPYFCEENVWKRALSDLSSTGLAVFVSNPQRQVALWSQRAGPEDGPIVWDYHVVYMSQDAAGTVIHDPDCRVGAVLPAETWLSASFPVPERTITQYRPWFRVVPRDLFVKAFASDRSHMRVGSGAWLKQPPPWPAPGEGMNLMRFVDMGAPFLGRVMTLDAFRAWLAAGAHPT
ncbi:MAG: hypothetical protein ACI9MR_001080 [Myxococcota bacterium]